MSPILVIATLVACASSAPPDPAAIQEAWPRTPPSALAAAPFELAHIDVEAATEALRTVHDDLALLPEANLRLARTAAAQAVLHPDTGNAARVPLMMQRTLARHADPQLAPLKKAVDMHVAVLEQLGVADLPPPAGGAALPEGEGERVATGEPLHRATQGQWPFDLPLVGISVEVQRLLGVVMDPDLHADLEALEDLLMPFVDARC